jgi:hypothetical protein
MKRKKKSYSSPEKRSGSRFGRSVTRKKRRSSAKKVRAVKKWEKRLPATARARLSAKIKILRREGYPPKQAAAIAYRSLSVKRKSKKSRDCYGLHFHGSKKAKGRDYEAETIGGWQQEHGGYSKPEKPSSYTSERYKLLLKRHRRHKAYNQSQQFQGGSDQTRKKRTTHARKRSYKSRR